MSSPGFEMSLEHQIPVLMKKTQMNGEHAGAQCGITSLLPSMSCRGRAAAFARDLHTRLRNLGSAHQAEDEATAAAWLSRDAAHRPSPSAPADLDTFYDFELECESPSSPVDEFEAPFPEHSPSEDQEQPFYDADVEPEHKHKPQQPEKKTNGFTFSTAFFTESSPVKQQPALRENGHAEKSLYSPITFEGCARQNSFDETDCVPSCLASGLERLSLPGNFNTTLDSDSVESSEFESAKSDPSDSAEDLIDEDAKLEEANEAIEENEKDNKDVPSESLETISLEVKTTNGFLENTTDEIIEVPADKETPPSFICEETKSDDLEEDDRPQRVRRCSSLKTGKTPPGTPGRKKIVRFADVLGLDLADVKTFMDEIPVIPKSAYDDLTGCDFVQNSPPTRPPPRFGALTLVPLFQVPRDLTEKLSKQNICLESARVGDGVHITVCGSVRVRNLDFHKTVHVRYTMNRWKTYTDLQATYVQGSCDGFSDKFQFVLYAPCISSGQRLEIAVRFQCKGQQFWDNNSGANYCFDCLALGATNSPTSPAGPLHPTLDWHPSFY